MGVGEGGHLFVKPEVATGLHGDGRAGAAMDEDVLDGGAAGDGFVDDGFELDLGAAAVAAVLGEDQFAGGIVDAVGDGLGGEPAEDDRVDGTDAGACEQGHGELGAHAHVDGDAVAFADAELLEDGGEALDLDVELGEGDAADFAGLAFPEECDLVAELALGVAVDAVVGEVELAAVEPGG